MPEVPIPQCIDTAKDLGLPWPDGRVSVMPTFTCQACGNEFPPKMLKGEIIDLTCKCGWSGNDALEECTTDELLGR